MNTNQPIFIANCNPELIQVCEKFQLKQTDNAAFELAFIDNRLTLFKRDEPKMTGIQVDFVSGATAHRRKFGGGRGQAIAKAVGLKQGKTPSVLDATAGLGRDAFVLASLGCQVQLIERHPIVAALLDDGLNRAYQDPDIGAWMQQRMQLLKVRNLDDMQNDSINVDVVYLDPMYPHRNKSALVKKEMRVFQTLVGEDLDADTLLAPAMALAKSRVVVKRPDYAAPLNQTKPSMVIDTKKNRFDVYVKAALEQSS